MSPGRSNGDHHGDHGREFEAQTAPRSLHPEGIAVFIEHACREVQIVEHCEVRCERDDQQRHQPERRLPPSWKRRLVMQNPSHIKTNRLIDQAL